MMDISNMVLDSKSDYERLCKYAKTQSAIVKMEAKGFHLDTHSTLLSRKHSYHCLIGKLRFTKVKKVAK